MNERFELHRIAHASVQPSDLLERELASKHDARGSKASVGEGGFGIGDRCLRGDMYGYVWGMLMHKQHGAKVSHNDGIDTLCVQETQVVGQRVEVGIVHESVYGDVNPDVALMCIANCLSQLVV
jgi:hypothetical protein